MHTKRPVAIIGYEEGLAGQITSWVEKDLGFEIKCYVNPSDEPLNIDEAAARRRPAKQFDVPTASSYKQRELINFSDFKPELKSRGIFDVIIALSDSRARERVFHYLRSCTTFRVLNCIHPSAIVLADVLFGDGVIVEPLSYIGYRAEVGNCVHIKAGAHLDHHSVLKDYVTLCPRAVIVGNSIIHEHTLVYANATVINRICISRDNTIGAGAVVVDDVLSSGNLLVGVPAKTKKDTNNCT
jgi:UDP-N-acetylbacillosamine N-acetyltransferase